MSFFTALFVLLLAVILSTAVSKILPLPLALIQIILGLAASILPLHISLEFEPELFMICVIAPLLFSEGQKASRKELWQLRTPIILLAFGLVFLTVGLGGFLIHWLIPSMPLAVAFALAATISPTDNVAVKSITRGLKLPSNVMPILEGESLLNDAAGIVSFKVALAAALTGVFSFGGASVEFLFVSIGGLVIGVVAGYVIVTIRLQLLKHGFQDDSMLIVLQVMTPFFLYVLAEEVHVSGILAVVAASIIHGIERDRLQQTTTKLQILSNNTWTIVEYVLNGLVFVLLGFLLPEVYQGIQETNEIGMVRLFGVIIIVFIALFLIRFLWVYSLYGPFTTPPKSRMERFVSKNYQNHIKTGDTETETVGRGYYALIMATSGIHGTITLATALSIPFYLDDGSLFPMRNTVLFVATGVILLSLIFASVALPIMIPKPEKRDDGLLSFKEVYRLILKQTINQLQADAVRETQLAVNLVVRDLEEQLVDLEKGILQDPNKQTIESLIKVGREAEQKRIEEMASKEGISEDAYQLYQVLMTQPEQYLVNTTFSRFKRAFQIARIRRRFRKRWKENWELHAEQILSTTPEVGNELKRLRAAGAQAAIDAIREQTTSANRHEALIVTQLYNKKLIGRYRSFESDEAFQEQLHKFRMRAIRMERDAIHEYVQEERISVATAAKLREAVTYDEMVVLSVDSSH
ncbi:Na+/H+ antiporter [Terribacillus saccharophilus]|uniref:Na+/H+ antiporter n=1 Tax=Terribacillus saccharophilus TaxID=361277 RepID=UPI0039823791